MEEMGMDFPLELDMWETTPDPEIPAQIDEESDINFFLSSSICAGISGSDLPLYGSLPLCPYTEAKPTDIHIKQEVFLVAPLPKEALPKDLTKEFVPKETDLLKDALPKDAVPNKTDSSRKEKPLPKLNFTKAKKEKSYKKQLQERSLKVSSKVFLNETNETVGLTILPIDPSLELKPLPCPFDAFSFDGQFGLTVLAMQTGKANAQILCRFTHCPKDRIKDLIGEAGEKQPNEAFLYPSLCSAARRANLKAINGWTFFYVLVVQGTTTYRVPLQQFKTPGPGFTRHPGMKYTTEEINYMCDLALQNKKMGDTLITDRENNTRRKTEVVPKFLKDMLRVLPTQIIPYPEKPVVYSNYSLPPVQPNFHPSFVHFS